MTPRDPFAVLQSALAVTPSPEFAARTRSRVAAAPPARAFVPVWKSAWMFGALAAAAVAAVVTVNVTRTRNVAAPVDASNVAAAPDPVASNAAPPAPTTVAPPRMPSVPHVRRTAATSAPAVDSFYEVIVPDDQRIALERLLLGMKQGRASVPRAAVTTELDDEGNRVIVPLPDIVPMKIEPLAGTPGDNKREEIKRDAGSNKEP